MKENFQIFNIIFDFPNFSVKSKIAHIEFTQNSILDVSGRSLIQLKYNPDILDYIYNSEDANEQAQNIVTSTKGSVYTVVAGAIVLMLSSEFQMISSLIDLITLLVFIQFINIRWPINLKAFFDGVDTFMMK